LTKPSPTAPRRERIHACLARPHPARQAVLIIAAITLMMAGFAHAQAIPGPVAADKAFALGSPPLAIGNVTTPAKVELGKTLFFDPRLSANGTVSCASCHNPALGWSDGLKTGIGINGSVLGRATPTIVNVAYNTQFMWDGRKKSLEDQALGPMKTPEEMKSDMGAVLQMLAAIDGYRTMFTQAFPAEPITEETLAKALAAFERSVVSRDSRFDRWLAGHRSALTPQEWRGFQVFKDPARGNCAACHSGPNFTDNGFHNIGIAQAEGKADPGRFSVRALASMKGAFKTPTLRDVALTAPYFRDGSAATLAEVVEHYDRGGDDKSNLSKDIRPLRLSSTEKADLVAFMLALTGRTSSFALPVLPQPSQAAPLWANRPVQTARSGD
jgi:cytochrome c peroxidase